MRRASLAPQGWRYFGIELLVKGELSSRSPITLYVALPDHSAGRSSSPSGLRALSLYNGPIRGCAGLGRGVRSLSDTEGEADGRVQQSATSKVRFGALLRLDAKSGEVRLSRLFMRLSCVFAL
jgi:hypothetical protein